MEQLIRHNAFFAFSYKKAFFVSVVIILFFIGKKIYWSHSHHVGYASKQSTYVSVDIVGYNQNRQTVYDLLQNKIGHNDYVFAGDSHIELFDLQEYFEKDLVKMKHGGMLRNRGISGDNTEGLFNRVEQFTTGKPEKVFLGIGFNDLAGGIPSDTVLKHISLIVKKILVQSPRTKIYILSIFPNGNTTPRGTSLRDTIPVMNTKLSNYCKHTGVVFINGYDVLSENGILKKSYSNRDGIHLSGKGYLALSKVIEPYL